MKKSYLRILRKCGAKLSKNEVKFLLNITKIIPEQGVIVEIGSYKGGSTCMLAKGSKINKKGKVYTIDPKISNLQSLKKNIKNAGVEEKVITITKTSKGAAKNWKKPISLLWIDGNHNYNYVKIDFLLWEKYLVKNGIIAIHDSRKSKNNILFANRKPKSYPGPKKLVREYVLNSKRFKNIGFIDTITYAKKIKDPSPLELLKKMFIITVFKITVFKKIDKNLGLLGIFLKKHYPTLYFCIKKVKEQIR